MKKPKHAKLAAPTFREIEAELVDAVRLARDVAEAHLKAQGFAPGALVHSRPYGRDEGQFRLTRIRWGRVGFPFLSFYGHKLRRDGTFSTHEHSLSGQPGFLAVVSEP